MLGTIKNILCRNSAAYLTFRLSLNKPTFFITSTCFRHTQKASVLFSKNDEFEEVFQHQRRQLSAPSGERPSHSEMMTSHDLDLYDNTIDINDEADENELEDEARRKAIRDEIDSRTGRLWTDPWEIKEEEWGAGKKLDDLANWSHELCSRVSLRKIQVHPDGAPTLENLATLPLPPPQPQHPAYGRPGPYMKHRKQKIFNCIQKAVSDFAETHIERILSLNDWNEKQDAIDDLFEQVQVAIKNGKDGDDYMSVILGSQPNFPHMLEKSLEEYLRYVVKKEKEMFVSKIEVNHDSPPTNDSKGDTNLDQDSLPIFLDLMRVNGSTLDMNGVPKLLYPLKHHSKDGPGRMLEEWELAANEDTKRLMARQCIRDVARKLVACQGKESSEGCRVYLKGRMGVGKSTALASIVVSARLSGHIVLYLPDGDRLRKNGFYIEPNSLRAGDKIFDLPMLAQEVCGQLLESHEKDLEGMTTTSKSLEKKMSRQELRKVSKYIVEEDGGFVITLIDLLKLASENPDLASGCYGTVVHYLMNQSEKPFTVVMDEFNCYFDHGHYFHEDYDPAVHRAIPPNKITLFEPLLDAIGVEKKDDGRFLTKNPILMRRGGIVVGTTESHAVADKFTKELNIAIKSNGCHTVEVPEYSLLEVEHILANFEVIGIGRLRFDKGATVMDEQEVAYLRMLSGGVGQKLLDSCIV